MTLTYVKPVQRCENSNIESSRRYVDCWAGLTKANCMPDQGIPVGLFEGYLIYINNFNVQMSVYGSKKTTLFHLQLWQAHASVSAATALSNRGVVFSNGVTMKMVTDIQ